MTKLLTFLLLLLAFASRAQVPPLPAHPTNSVPPANLPYRAPVTNVSAGKSVEYWFTTSTNCTFTLQWSTNGVRGPWTNIATTIFTINTNGSYVITNRLLIHSNFPNQFFRLVTNHATN